MRKRADMSAGHTPHKSNRAEPASELALVTVLLVAAVLLAAYAAGGPVLDVLLG